VAGASCLTRRQICWQFLGLFWVGTHAYAEIPVQDQLAFIVGANPVEIEGSSSDARPLSKETGEIKLAGVGLLRMYQRYIATQDLPACSFHPSCSQFGVEAITRYGFPRGVLLTADRLMRDNGMRMAHRYRLHEASGRYLDPVSHYDAESSQAACVICSPGQR
jgi:uncharacterized protein